MKKIFGFYTKTPLILRIAIGLVIGAGLGILGTVLIQRRKRI